MGRGSSAREEEELPGESALLGGTSLPVPVAPSHPVSLGVFVYVCVFGGSGDSQDRLGQSILPGPLPVPPGAWFLSAGLVSLRFVGDKEGSQVGSPTSP